MPRPVTIAVALAAAAFVALLAAAPVVLATVVALALLAALPALATAATVTAVARLDVRRLQPSGEVRDRSSLPSERPGPPTTERAD